jgi:ketosteroid isomerase-like protein
MNEQKQAVLEANRVFYDAFARADYKTMETLWAREHDLAVIHPGWSPLHGRKAVLDAWRRIFDGAAESNLNCSEARVYFMDDAAFVICIERMPEGEVVATNIFVQEQGEWKLTLHHGGLIAQITRDFSGDAVH